MSTINLLPWREAKRKELLQQFLISFGFVFLIAASVWGLGHYYHSQLIGNQILRIGMVDEKIAEVDKRLKKLESWKKKKNNYCHAYGLLRKYRVIAH